MDTETAAGTRQAAKGSAEPEGNAVGRAEAARGVGGGNAGGGDGGGGRGEGREEGELVLWVLSELADSDAGSSKARQHYSSRKRGLKR